MNEERFTIVIVNWNGLELLRQCLVSIEACKADHDPEVIVVDNASRDDSVVCLRTEFPHVHVVASAENLGFARACNVGWEAATGGRILFLNPDASLREGTLGALAQLLDARPDVGAVGCKILNTDGSPQPLMFQGYPSPWREFVKLFLGHNIVASALGLTLRAPSAESSCEALKLSGACLTVRREVMDAVGGFDDLFFMYCEDGELCQRISMAGWKLYYLAEAEVIHHQGSCSRKAPKGFSTLMQSESFARYMRKYYGRTGPLRYRILLFIGAAIRLPASVLAYVVHGQSAPSREVGRKRVLKNWLLLKWSCGLAKPAIPE